MSDTLLVKNVIAGSMEYTAKVSTMSANDTLQLTFDNDLILDDILVAIESGSNLQFDLSLVYPSGSELDIVTGQSSDYTMNQDGDSRNLWYRIPKWTTLKVDFTEVTTAKPVKVSVIGRG